MCMGLYSSHYAFWLPLISVMAQVRVEKEFPDMRQNERDIKFIRVGDTVRTVGQLKEVPTLKSGP